ncbi:MAG: hypothetical protein M3155_09970 [Actinomycetota bacterium]|nr:hypothetical protein [Actinomycetota bacterium]
MASVMTMRWDGVTPDQYEEVREKVRWEENRPKGANFHVCGFEGGAMRIVDIWDSPEDFQRFLDDRLAPIIQEAGFPGEPEVTFYPVHAVWAPAYEGASSSA